MHLPPVLMLTITLATGFVGLLFLLFPGSVKRLEEMLNAPWGDREIMSLRLGLRSEQVIEQTINRNVLDQKISWDGWTKRYPRVVGATLCLVAALFYWLM